MLFKILNAIESKITNKKHSPIYFSDFIFEFYSYLRQVAVSPLKPGVIQISI